MSIKIVFESDGEIMIDDVPVEFQSWRKLEDAILQMHAELEWARLAIEKCERAEAELAQLRAQEPVAWMWNDMIGIPHTHISPTRPTWPDAGASSAMSVAINVRPLYAEQVLAKVAE